MCSMSDKGCKKKVATSMTFLKQRKLQKTQTLHLYINSPAQISVWCSSASPNLYLLKVFITVDILFVMGVLQLVGFNVLPQGLDDTRAGLSVDS